MNIPLLNIANYKRDIYLFTRNDKGIQDIQKVSDFFPFFYEISNEKNSQYTGYDGVPLKKVFVSEPKEVTRMRSISSYSSDIKFPVNFLIHKISSIQTAPIKHFFLDIEILCKDMPETHQAKYPISCISIYNSFSKEIKTWFLGDFKNEDTMTNSFIDYIRQEKPDLICIWNAGFDYPYLCNRIKDFAKRISPINLSRLGEEKDIFYPAGISIVDDLRWYKKVNMREGSYALDYIAQKRLGETSWGKTDFNKLSVEVRSKNINDIKRLVKLEEIYNIIPYFDEIRRLTKTQWEDLYYNSRIIEMLLFEEAKKQNIILPNKQRNNEEETSFEGAIRDVEAVGLYENVGKFDLSSAYPAAIINFNLDSKNIKNKPNSNIITIHGIHFEQNDNALLPCVVKRILQLKDQGKKEKTNNPNDKVVAIKYDAIKGVANCFHPNTNVMTVNGIKNIKEIIVGDIVYNVNPMTLEVEKDTIIATQKYIYDDYLYNYNNQLSNLSVTKEHKFLVQKWGKNEKEFKNIEFLYNEQDRKKWLIPKILPIKQYNNYQYISLLSILKELNGMVYIKPPKDKVYKYRNIKITNIEKKANNSRLINNKRIYKWKIGEAKNISDKQLIKLYKNGWSIYGQVNKKEKLSPIIFKKELFLEFLGWFISEGSTYKTKIKKFKTTTRGESYNVSISQYNQNTLNEIRNLITSLGFETHKLQLHSVSFTSHLLYKYLEKECGFGARNKKIPKFIFEESSKNINILFISLYRGDGSNTRLRKNNTFYRYRTVSKQLNEDIIKLLILLGNNSIASRNTDDCFSIQFHNRFKGISTFIEKEYYKGEVYCVTTLKNHNIFAGNKGFFTLTGQSAFGVMGNSFFRLFDVNVASSITFLVRDVLTYVMEQIKKEGLKVIYYDTDSIFINTKENIVDKLNNYVKQWALEKYNKKDMNLSFEFQGYFDKLFLLGRCHYYGLVHGEKEPEIKGIEAKRSNSSKYESYFQTELLNKIISNIPQIQIDQWINQEQERIISLPLEEVAFPCKLANKEYINYPIFERAYDTTRHLKPDFKVNKGEIFYYLFMNNGEVMAFLQDDHSFIDRNKIDWKQMITRNIFYKAQKIYDAMHWELQKNLNQMSLV